MSTKQTSRKQGLFTGVRALGLSTGLALCLSAGNSQAIFGFGDIVFDPAAFGQMLTDFKTMTNQLTQAKEQVSKVTSQLNDMRAKLGAMQSMFEMNSSLDMKEIPDEETFMVKDKCGPQGGGGFGGIFTAMTGVDLRSDVFVQQYKYCASMQVARNKQYNLTVRFMRDSKEKVQAAKTKFDSLASQSDNAGRKQDAIRVATQTASELEQNQKKFENENAALTSYIALQEKFQSALATGAMRGTPGLLTKVTSAAMLTAALCQDGQCDN